MSKLHFEVLNKKQLRLFPQLDFLHGQKFYLAGGTALALHLGHRTSLDLDFYHQSHFDSLALSETINDLFGPKAKITAREKDTLFCQISGVDFSFFWYKYPLLKKPLVTKGLLLASLEDIAAMKMIAITQRPAKRDYIDIYFLLKLLTLKKMFALVGKKYPNFNQYFALRALGYFQDLKDEQARRIRVFDKDFSWEKAKEKIFAEVKRYQLAMIKGGKR